MIPNWANLTKEERAEYMRLQMSPSGNFYGGGGYLPDDCSECGKKGVYPLKDKKGVLISISNCRYCKQYPVGTATMLRAKEAKP